MNDNLILTTRCVLALVWLYNGLWLKVMDVSPHHLEIVSGIAPAIGLPPRVFLSIIGGLETLLAVGIVSGLFYRFVSYFQIGIILLMNTIGIVYGGGSIKEPAGLIIMNLPIVMCALIVAKHGPGPYAMRSIKQEEILK